MGAANERGLKAASAERFTPVEDREEVSERSQC